jgi:hypothetical protein
LNVPPEPDGTDEVEAEGHPLAGTSNTAIPTLYLFGPPTSFDGWGECPSDETAITAALLVIVSLGYRRLSADIWPSAFELNGLASTLRRFFFEIPHTAY